MAERLDASMAIEMTGMRFSWGGSRGPVLSIEKLRIRFDRTIRLADINALGNSQIEKASL